jgi:hypothetical protein
MKGIAVLDASDTGINRHPADILRPSDGASFLLLGDQSAIFSETAQKIYALNDVAACIWCRLEDGETIDAICDGLIESGVAPNLARKYVAQALRSWHKLGLLKSDWHSDHDLTPSAYSFNIRVADFRATIRVASERVTQLLTLFDHQTVPLQNGSHVLDIVEAGHLIQVFHNKRGVICCEAVELAPALKAYITDQVVAASSPNVVFHAACLERDGRSVLISGRPGAGKTTLSLRLAAAGFEYGADDIVLVGPDGKATGVPFAPSIKPGAWQIVSQFRPDINEAIVHRRPDGKRVRYVKPMRIARGGGSAVGWILFIRRGRGSTKLRPLKRIEVMRRLMEASYSPGEKMNLAMCNALKQTINGADCFELTYSDSAEASDAIVRLCND